MNSKWIEVGLISACLQSSLVSGAIDRSDLVEQTTSASEVAEGASELKITIEASQLVAKKMRDRLKSNVEPERSKLLATQSNQEAAVMLKIEASQLVAKKMRDHFKPDSEVEIADFT